MTDLETAEAIVVEQPEALLPDVFVVREAALMRFLGSKRGVEIDPEAAEAMTRRLAAVATEFLLPTSDVPTALRAAIDYRDPQSRSIDG